MTVRVIQSGREYLASRYAVRVPAVGEWTAEVTVASGDIATGACEVTDGTTSRVGTIRAAHVDGGTTTLDIRAGADGLDRATVARHWANFTDTQQVLSTLAGDAAETATTTATSLGSWRSRGRTLREEVRALARWAASDGWRYRPDGAIELGAAAWVSADAPGPLIDAGAGWRSYSCDALPELAGATVDGERVGLATYVDAGPGTVAMVDLRAERLADGATHALVGGALEDLTGERATIRLDSGEVLSNVPLWFLPGVRAVVPAGVRVIVVDLGGDPRQPIAFCAPFDGAADEVELEAATRVTVAAPTVDIGDAVNLSGGHALILRDGECITLEVDPILNVAPPIPPPGPLITAGILPTTLLRIRVNPLFKLPGLPPSPPLIGPSGAKA
jgi:hypothetical protein